MSEQALDQSLATDSKTVEIIGDNADGNTNEVVAETDAEKPTTAPKEEPETAVSTYNQEAGEASDEHESASTYTESEPLLGETNAAVPTSDEDICNESSVVESGPSIDEIPFEETLQIIELTTTHDSDFLSRCFKFLYPFYESKCMLLFHILLLVMPISSGFMGARYMDECPFNATTPTLLFVLGVAGTIAILFKILLISQKLILPQYIEWQWARTSLTCANMLVIIFFLLEMGLFFRKSPSFEPGNPAYCNEIFYTFTYWMNWSCLFAIILKTIVELPHCSFECPNTPLGVVE